MLWHALLDPAIVLILCNDDLTFWSLCLSLSVHSIIFIGDKNKVHISLYYNVLYCTLLYNLHYRGNALLDGIRKEKFLLSLLYKLYAWRNSKITIIVISNWHSSRCSNFFLIFWFCMCAINVLYKSSQGSVGNKKDNIKTKMKYKHKEMEWNKIK